MSINIAVLQLYCLFIILFILSVIIISHDQVINAAILGHTFIVEFTVFNQMCTDCHKKETNNFWKSTCHDKMNNML